MSFLGRFNKQDQADGLPDMSAGEPTLGEQLAQSRAERQQRLAAAPSEPQDDMPVLGKKGMSGAMKGILVAVAVVAGLAALVAVNQGQKPTGEERTKAKKEKEAAEKQVKNTLPPPASVFGMPPAPPMPATADSGARAGFGGPGAGQGGAAAGQVPPIGMAQGGMQPGGMGMAPHWSERKLSGAILAGSGLGGIGTASPAAPGAQDPLAQALAAQQRAAGTPGPLGAAPAVQPAAGSSTDLGSRLVPTVARAAAAERLPDRNFLLTKGTSLDCALETALQSNVPGLVTCRLTRDVYSDNGQVLLLDRGSRMVGEYQGGIKQGQVRVFVLWSRAQTPNGVVINLNSPGTDPLGRAGLDGWVDNHFAERFGAAIMLSLVQDAVASLSRTGNGSTTNYYGNTAEAGSKIVEKMLDSTVNIPPTIVKNQGEHVQVMLARDLDFSSVYALRLKP
jgi:type IV secretion system protein VirB10